MKFISSSSATLQYILRPSYNAQVKYLYLQLNKTNKQIYILYIYNVNVTIRRVSLWVMQITFLSSTVTK